MTGSAAAGSHNQLTLNLFSSSSLTRFSHSSPLRIPRYSEIQLKAHMDMVAPVTESEFPLMMADANGEAVCGSQASFAVSSISRTHAEA